MEESTKLQESQLVQEPDKEISQQETKDIEQQEIKEKEEEKQEKQIQKYTGNLDEDSEESSGSEDDVEEIGGRLPLTEKNFGNDNFRNKNFEEAAKYYQRALTAVQVVIKEKMVKDESRFIEKVIIPSHVNIAQCFIVLERDYESAIKNCTEALQRQEIENHRIMKLKAYYRRAVARMRLGYLDEAKEDLLIANKMENNNTQIRKTWEELQERKKAYAKKYQKLSKKMITGDNKDYIQEDQQENQQKNQVQPAEAQPIEIQKGEKQQVQDIKVQKQKVISQKPQKSTQQTSEKRSKCRQIIDKIRQTFCKRKKH